MAEKILPISKADAARAKGRSRATVTEACRPGGALAAAVLPDGRLNSAHKSYKAWLAGADRAPTKVAKRAHSRAPKPTTSAKPGRNRASKPTAPAPVEPAPGSQARVPTDDELTGLLQTFGTHRNLSDSLKLRKAYVDLSEKELRLKEAKGQLVKREILVTIVSSFDQAFHQLLTDLPKTATRELYTMARAGRSLEEAESKHKELVSSHLTTAKEQVRHALRSAHGPAT